MAVSNRGGYTPSCTAMYQNGYEFLELPEAYMGSHTLVCLIVQNNDLLILKKKNWWEEHVQVHEYVLNCVAWAINTGMNMVEYTVMFIRDGLPRLVKRGHVV